ncbi:MAG: tRNA (cytidine(34)-2'-O)-methyltransferase, partial [Lachnospiraceae bacterium]|nr:tRNA (cytidine(34)-2'-O)-methyltransferase [Candidatus Equihabitans merdae]
MVRLVLLEPEIPGNTGNIGRTCVAVGAELHLIEPLGFNLSEKSIRRAGMDYWPRLNVYRWATYEEFMAHADDVPVYYVTTKGCQLYTDVEYPEDCYLMFGKESAGIPEEILAANPTK